MNLGSSAAIEWTRGLREPAAVTGNEEAFREGKASFTEPCGSALRDGRKTSGLIGLAEMNRNYFFFFGAAFFFAGAFFLVFAGAFLVGIATSFKTSGEAWTALPTLKASTTSPPPIEAQY